MASTLNVDNLGSYSGTTVTLEDKLDANGIEIILDADADTSITADTDDQIDFRIGGVDELTLTATKADNLDDIAALSHSDGNFLVSDGTNWTNESGATARTSLGLGTMATQAANNVSITGGSLSSVTVSATSVSTAAATITGGSVTGITDLAVADGGTGASDASGARTNLGLGTIATQAANSVAITGGSVTGITDLALADGGTGASLADPGADRIMFWDESGNVVTWLEVGSGLGISGTTLSNTSSSSWTLVSKTADETVNNSSTMQDDDHLTFAVSASTTYTVRGQLFVTVNGAADFKMQFTGPASPTLVYIGIDYFVPAGQWEGGSATAFSSAITGIGNGTPTIITINAVIQNGANSGNVTLQWAQNAAHASNCTVLKGSWLEYRAV